MQAYIIEFLNYNRAMNQKIIDLIAGDTGRVPDETVTMMCHILNAQQIWNCRIQGKPFAITPFSKHPVEKLHEVNSVESTVSLSIAELEDPARIVNYATLTGIPYQNAVQDILLHIVNHATYHRGQIAMQLKQAGLQPPVTDFIAYKR